ncbi:MAG TPA: hypothetical protein VEQ38_25575 [Verrucomicrobiae bacterium]|nr:hypothetical protein [Verrucomicrobiae bacterium]
MNFDDTNPTDPAAAAELHELVTNPAHPQHAAFYRGENAALAYRQQLMDRAYAGQTYDPSNNSTLLAEWQTEAMKGQQPATPQGQPQEGGATLLQAQAATEREMIQQTEAILRSDPDYGGNYDENIEILKNTALRFFGSEDAIKAVAARANLSPGADAAVAKLLTEIGKGKL